MGRRSLAWRLAPAGLLAVAAASCGKGADPAVGPPVVPATAGSSAVAAADRRPASTHPSCLDPGDRIEVRVAGLTDPGQVSAMTTRVQGDGTVGLAYLVRPVAVAYADPVEAARRIAAAYREAAVLSTAQVVVRRVDFPEPSPTAGATGAEPSIAARPTTRPGTYDVGDLLEVRVSALPGLSPIAVRVQADGTVGLPLVRRPVVVGGQLPAEAARAVAGAYRAANIVSQAAVTIRRLQVAGTGGATPGPIGLFDLVRCVVGDLSPTGGPTVVVARIDAHGDLPLPLVTAVHVSDLTDGQAAAAVASAYRQANVIGGASVSVLLLERAPADAARLSLPDEPLGPVPVSLRGLYEPR